MNLRFFSRQSRGPTDLAVPRGATTGIGARYDPDAFGRMTETIARFMGTGRYLAGQTVYIVAWITLNVAGIIGRWDPTRSSCST